MKESFGFIERADVVKEIFFHFSEAKTKEELRLGDDVEFIIQTRNVSKVESLYIPVHSAVNVTRFNIRIVNTDEPERHLILLILCKSKHSQDALFKRQSNQTKRKPSNGTCNFHKLEHITGTRS